MDSVVVSVRIKKDLKAKLEKEGIDVEKAVKDYLSQRAAQIELKKVVEKATEMLKSGIKSGKIKPSKKGWSVRAIRYDRYVAH